MKFIIYTILMMSAKAYCDDGPINYCCCGTSFSIVQTCEARYSCSIDGFNRCVSYNCPTIGRPGPCPSGHVCSCPFCSTKDLEKVRNFKESDPYITLLNKGVYIHKVSTDIFNLLKNLEGITPFEDPEEGNGVVMSREQYNAMDKQIFNGITIFDAADETQMSRCKMMKIKRELELQ